MRTPCSQPCATHVHNTSGPSLKFVGIACSKNAKCHVQILQKFMFNFCKNGGAILSARSPKSLKNQWVLRCVGRKSFVQKCCIPLYKIHPFSSTKQLVLYMRLGHFCTNIFAIFVRRVLHFWSKVSVDFAPGPGAPGRLDPARSRVCFWPIKKN